MEALLSLLRSRMARMLHEPVSSALVKGGWWSARSDDEEECVCACACVHTRHSIELEAMCAI